MAWGDDEDGDMGNYGAPPPGYGPPSQPYSQQPQGYQQQGYPQTMPCPACGNPVSPAAPQCPRCGHPIARQAAPLVNRGGSSVLSIVLVLVFVLVAAGGITAYFLFGRSASTDEAGQTARGGGGVTPQGPGVGGLPGLIGQVARQPEVVVDEEMAVTAEGGAQMRGFTLPSERPVFVQVEGRSHADKGFMVYVMPSSEWENFKSGSFKHIPEFEGLKVRSFSHTGELPAGSWALVVSNSENIMNTMVVHVRVVVDPK